MKWDEPGGGGGGRRICGEYLDGFVENKRLMQKTDDGIEQN
jgi:hypothetical protein